MTTYDTTSLLWLLLLEVIPRGRGEGVGGRGGEAQAKEHQQNEKREKQLSRPHMI